MTSGILSTILVHFIVTFIILPLVILISIPLLLWRSLAIVTSKLNPRIRRPLSLISCIFAVDDIYKNPSCTLSTFLSFAESPDRSLLEKRLLNLVETKYPELSQKLVRWLGFFFWEDDTSFNLNNHWTVITEEFSTPEQLEQHKERLIKKPFFKEHSLWEIVIYENITFKKDIKCIIGLRIHHSLADGYSLLNFFKSLSGNEEMLKLVAKPNEANKRSFLHVAAYFLKFFLIGPTQTLVSVIQCKDQNAWKVPQDQVQGVAYKTEINPGICMERVKQIAKSHSVKTTTIIFTALTGGIRKFMLETGTPVPQYLTVICPLPLSNHPEYLTNHMTLLPVRAPVSEPDIRKRLQIVQSTFDFLSNSVLPLGFACLFRFMGLLASVLKRRTGSPMGTLVMTNFPTPGKKQVLLGKIAEELSFNAGLQRRGLALGFFSISYGGKLIIGTKADVSLFPDPSSVTRFTQLVYDEFEYLEKAV